MTLKYTALAPLAIAVALLPAIASAQAVGSSYVTVSTVPSSAVYSPGSTNANLGTVTFTGTQEGTVQVASVPISINGTNGATAADLSNCELVNSNGAVLNNVSSTLSAGTNTVTFATPLSVTSGSPQTLTVECGVDSVAPLGASYTVSAGVPTLAPALTATLTSFPTVDAGAVNAPVAAITLNPAASGANINVTSIPLTATYSGGLTSNDLSNCRLTNGGISIDQNANGIINAGANTFMLDTTLPLTGGTSATPLILTCNVLGAAPVGGAVTLSLAPAGILASNASTGTAISPTQGYDGTTGDPGTLSGTTDIAATGSTGTVVPPNTGAGASAPISIALLTLAALAVVAGIGMLVRQKA